MNKKEVLEIRKLFNINKCCIDKICGCYVDGNKNKVTTFKDAFYSLSEEEEHKYFTLFRATLGGRIGKNLMNMEFPTDEEMEGGAQKFLMDILESGLEDDALLDLFYNKIIDNYEYGENYLILLINGTYDVPGKASDGFDMDDASDYVYSHICCTICPVKLSKEGLCYNAESNSIEQRIRDWIVEAPAHGFLFPAFNDRNTDIHSMLYFSHKPTEIQENFIGGMFGALAPLSSKIQKEAFDEIISDALGEACDFETVKNIHENLTSFMEDHKEDVDPIALDKTDMKKLLETSGVANEKIEKFDEKFVEHTAEKTNFDAINVYNAKTFDIKAPDVIVKVAADRTDLVETREIDGKKYLLIELTENVEVNGITARP